MRRLLQIAVAVVAAVIGIILLFQLLRATFSLLLVVLAAIAFLVAFGLAWVALRSSDRASGSHP